MILTEKYGMVRIQSDRHLLGKYMDTVETEEDYFDIYFNNRYELVAIPLNTKKEQTQQNVEPPQEKKTIKITNVKCETFTTKEAAEILKITPAQLRKKLRNMGNIEKNEKGKYIITNSIIDSLR